MFIIGSVSALCGAGSGGVLMAFLRMESKWDDRVWRPGSIFMEGLSVFM